MTTTLQHASRPARIIPILLPFATAYGLAVRVREAAYRYGFLSRHSLPVPVISVGNLTVGGSGKTPVVIWIVQRLLATGRRVAVISRGYRRQSRATRLLVSDGRRLLVDPQAAGDEPYLIAQRCAGAVVAVGANRYETGRWLLDQQPLDCIVLDDGFQHLGLIRDLDLLLVDVTDHDSFDHLLPAGELREPLSAARRANAVLLTRADSPVETAAMRARLRPSLSVEQPLIRLVFELETVTDLRTGKVQEPTTLAGRAALAVSGIARPTSFRRLLERAGVKVAGEVVFRDHHHYRAEDLARIQSTALECGAETILTTEKDAVKIAPLLQDDQGGKLIGVVRLGCAIVEGREALENLIASVLRGR